MFRPLALLSIAAAAACGSTEQNQGTATAGSHTGAGGSSATSSSAVGGSAGSGGATATGGSAGDTTLAACEGFSPAQGRTPCRSDAECSTSGSPNDFGCFLPSSPRPPVCGDGCNPTRTCNTDNDCAEGGICHEYEDPCCVALGQPATGTYCIERCTETSCDNGVCRDDGRCEELPCQPGGCAVNQECDATTGRCVFRSCSRDSDCDCGFCALVCQNGPGYCDFLTGG